MFRHSSNGKKGLLDSHDEKTMAIMTVTTDYVMEKLLEVQLVAPTIATMVNDVNWIFYG